MTERKTSYLTGLSLANHYARLDAFKGNVAAGFGAMLLLRNSTPLDGFAGSEEQFLCGNLEAPALDNTKGWGLRWTAGPQPNGLLELVYGDSALGQQMLAAELRAPVPMAQRTALLHVFLLTDPALSAPDNVTALLYVNGALVARSDELSFTPASGAGSFRIGGASINGSPVNAPGIGVSGFGYIDTVPGASLAVKLAVAQNTVDATLAQAVATGDIAADALVTNLLSVRRGLSVPMPVWAASKGTLNLNRVGSSSLSVEAADPLFGDAPFEEGGNLTDILDRLSVKPLAAWWTTRLRDGANVWGIANNNNASQSPVFFDAQGRFPVAPLKALSMGSFDVGAARLFDQVRNNDLGPATAFPKMFDGATQLPVKEGQSQVMDFVTGVPGQYFDRGDALGLEPDSGLTLAWKCRLGQPFTNATFPNLISLGTAATPQINVFFTTDGVNDIISISNSADSHFVTCNLPLGALLNWNAFVLTKPAGSNGYSNTWKLYLNGVDQGLPTFVIAGADPLGDTLTRIGDFGAAGGAPGGFPFVGTCIGMMVFGAVLSDADRQQLNGFLAAA